MASDAWALCREIRRRRGWTQRTLAQQAGTTPAIIARIEKGRMQPTIQLLGRIARAAGFELAISISDIDPDETKARTHARSLTLEQRLRQNDRLSALRAGSTGARRG